MKGKLTPLTGEIDADWLKIKEAITKAAEKSLGYKKWKSRKWLRTWNEEIQRAIVEKKASYRKYRVTIKEIDTFNVVLKRNY